MKKICLLLLVVLQTITNAQHTVLTDFSNNGAFTSGDQSLEQNLISDGVFLYGVGKGGSNYKGKLFKIAPNGTAYSTLIDFAGSTNGSDPCGTLLYDGTFLYGMTTTGGMNNLGTIYKIMPNGTGYTKLYDFSASTDGSTPVGSLILDGNFLYGMTTSNGAHNFGTIFKIMPNGTGFSKLLDFDGLGNGRLPRGSLFSDGTFLYGTTFSGGANNLGTIFKIMPNGTNYTKMLDFTGSAGGSSPTGTLIYDGTFLYGMTAGGGSNSLGSIFKITPSSTGFVIMMSFVGSTNGGRPTGSLISDGTFLYGMTEQGGANNLGTIFRIQPNGTGYAKLLDFSGTSNGANPYGSLMLDGGFFYGITSQGGANNAGTIFKIMPNGSGHTILQNFIGAVNGAVPYGSLASDGNFLYGMTNQGGTNGLGTIFKIKPDGTGFTKLMDFAGATNGAGPAGCSLIWDGTFLYGMTTVGGINNTGTIFKILPNGSGYTKLKDFNIEGQPNGSLVSDGTFLYGMTTSSITTSSVNFNGSIFKIKNDGTGYTTLLNFDPVTTGYGTFENSLMYDGTFLYGMTNNGGINYSGTIFRILPNGSGYNQFVDFGGAISGMLPTGTLISDGTFLYGMTKDGGANGLGTIFKVKTDGTGFTNLMDFAGATDGSYPHGSLISDGTYFYGMTSQGGANNLGTMFKIKPNGTGYTKLMDFSVASGSSSNGSLILDGTFLYGLAPYDGPRGVGTVFKYKYCSPVTINANNTTTLCTGSSITLTGNGATSYTWSGGITNGLGFIPTTSTIYSVTGSGAGVCTDTATVSVIVDNTCQDVWPGDANSDGIADNFDVLELGLHFTQTGPARTTTSNAWQSYFANNWTGTISNGKNKNHSDCNGDGTINSNDTLAIFNNYGLVHAFKPVEQVVVNPQLSIVPDQNIVSKGNWGTASVFLGETSAPISNINGLAFTVAFDQNLIDANSFYIEYPASFINAGNQNLDFSKPDFTNGKLYTATTHTITNNVNGNGKIAVLHYKIKSTLATDEVLNISIINAKQSNASGVLTPLTAGTATVAAIGASVGMNELSTGSSIALYPNPANASATIQSSATLEKIELISITGKLISSEKASGDQHQLDLSALANGVYFVAVYDANQKVTRKKLVVQR